MPGAAVCFLWGGTIVGRVGTGGCAKHWEVHTAMVAHLPVRWIHAGSGAEKRC